MDLFALLGPMPEYQPGRPPAPNYNMSSLMHSVQEDFSSDRSAFKDDSMDGSRDRDD